MKFLFSFFIFISLQSVSFAEMLSYDELSSLVESKNRDVTASKIEVDAAALRMGYMRRSFIPKVEAWAGPERFKTQTYSTKEEMGYGVAATLNLFRGGRDSLEEDAREAGVLATRANQERIYQTELLEVRQYFWNLVYLREIRAVYEKTLEYNKKNLSRALIKINAGLSTKVDRLEFEISDTQLLQDMARMDVEISNLQRRISALIGKPAETTYETISEIPHDHDDPTARTVMDFDTFRDVRLELASQSQLSAQGQIQKLWWTPSLDLYAGQWLYNYRERSFNSDQYQTDKAIGLRLTFSFDGFQSKRDGESLTSKSQAANFRAQQIKAETEAEFNTLKQELLLLHELIHVGERNVMKGQEYLEVTLSEYNRGIKNSPDVLSATLKNLEFKRRFAELRRDYVITKARLQSMLSKTK